MGKIWEIYGYVIKTPLNFIKNKEKIAYFFMIYIGIPLKTPVEKNIGDTTYC